MSRNIITGAPCSGKSTLCAALMDRGFEVRPEISEVSWFVDDVFYNNAHTINYFLDTLRKNFGEFKQTIGEMSDGVCFIEGSPVNLAALCEAKAKLVNHKIPDLEVPSYLGDEELSKILDGFSVLFLGFSEKDYRARLNGRYSFALGGTKETAVNDAIKLTKQYDELLRGKYEELGIPIFDIPTSDVEVRVEDIVGKLELV